MSHATKELVQIGVLGNIAQYLGSRQDDLARGVDGLGGEGDPRGHAPSRDGHHDCVQARDLQGGWQFRGIKNTTKSLTKDQFEKKTCINY